MGIREGRGRENEREREKNRTGNEGTEADRRKRPCLLPSLLATVTIVVDREQADNGNDFESKPTLGRCRWQRLSN